MKIIKVNGHSREIYKPHEVAEIIGYNPRTIRRFIQNGRIKAVDSNKGGRQPVWWIPSSEVKRLQKLLYGSPLRSNRKKKKSK